VVNLTSGLYEAVVSVFGGLVTAIGILVIAFYMTVEEDGIKNFIRAVTPVSYQPYIIHKLAQIQKRLSSWLWGQLLLMCFIGTLTGVALWILGVPYALVLGILAGLLEFIPIIGPTVAAVPAVFFAFSDYAATPYKPFIVIVMFIVIQQVENQLLVPRVMKRAVGLNPIVVIVALLVGVKLGGFIGLVLAVPLVAIIDVFAGDFIAEKQREQNRLEA
jgi:predicted PurR-regulated permease PerM